MRKRSGFTLIELLVVVGILSLLIAIMLPALGRAKQRGVATKCLANLHGIGRGLMVYQSDNDGYVVPSYNMPRTASGGYKSSAAVGDLIDGWAAILDRAGVVPASQGPTNNIFYCPNTFNISGMDGGQTLYDQDKPNGYQNWPIQFTSAGGDGATKTVPTLPIAGFTDGSLPYEHLLRCGYWLNAQNPIGSAPAASPTSAPPCPYYTQSVGYGPYADGSAMPLVRANIFVRPQALIVATDGMYMGRNSVTRLGEQNRRVGYRHPGRSLTINVNGTTMTFDQTITNTVFADGHAEPINNNDFPHANVTAENNGPYSLLSAQ